MSQVMPASGDADGRLRSSSGSSDAVDSQTLHDTVAAVNDALVAAGRTDLVPRFAALVRLLPLHLHQQTLVEQPQQQPQPCPADAAVTANLPSSRYSEVARLQAGRAVKATDWWTLYPHELQAKILLHAGPLTQLLCGHLDVEEMDRDAKRALWIDGFEQDWQGNLDLLPYVYLDVEDFAHVSSRSIFHWLWACLTDYDPQKHRFTSIRHDLCTIPMRHMWLDSLPLLSHERLAALASEGDHVAFLEYMLDNDLIPLGAVEEIGYTSLKSRIDHAARYGSLDVIKMLSARGGIATSSAMNSAASHGHLDTVKWLHEHRTEGCTADAMDGAAEEGHLDVVQWLHEHRTEGCTTWAMDYAALNGHFDLVKWLHENRAEGCTTDAMDFAASQGHLDTVTWLHEHRAEGCTTQAMDSAAKNGYLDVVQWLHVNRVEGCTANAIDEAAENGELEVVHWLLANRMEGFTYWAITYTDDDDIARLLIQLLTAEQRAAMFCDAEDCDLPYVKRLQDRLFGEPDE